MKFSRSSVLSGVHKIPDLKFDDKNGQALTSFAGLVLYQDLFNRLRLKERLRDCFKGITNSPIYGYDIIVLLLIVHLSLGYRKLRDRDYYKDDPMVKRTLGLRRLPDVATISRSLRSVDGESVEKVRLLSKEIVLQRLGQFAPGRITIDFDGSVLSTMRHAEGTAVGYNKNKKGSRSYYPLFCTVAQTGQFLDIHHRSGNVHDSNGAIDFASNIVDEVRAALPQTKLEARMDSAFFNEDQLEEWNDQRVEFTVSVPFERFPELKQIIEKRKRWRKLDTEWSYFERSWSPKSWNTDFRFIFVRRKTKKQQKGSLQLELFAPVSHEYEYKVIVTNKTNRAGRVLKFHNGRGSQEGIFAEAKGNTQLEYIPVKKLDGNKLYCLCAILTHNLFREMQMNTYEKEYGTTAKRRPLWTFESLNTFRQNVIQRAGRLVRPQGKLTLFMANNKIVRTSMLAVLGSG